MKVSAAGRAAITQREGCRLVAYRDSRGIPTIGVGHVDMTPPTTVMGMRITAAQADALLAADLAPVEATINDAVKVPLTQNEFDALASLGFNIGVGGLARSTVIARLNRGDRAGAAQAFLLWGASGRVDGAPQGRGRAVPEAGRRAVRATGPRRSGGGHRGPGVKGALAHPDRAGPRPQPSLPHRLLALRLITKDTSMLRIFSSPQVGAHIIAIIVVAGFVAFVAALALHLVPQESQLLVAMGGLIGSKFSSVVDFYMGSSLGSAQKTAQIDHLIGRSGDAPAQQPMA